MSVLSHPNQSVLRKAYEPLKKLSALYTGGPVLVSPDEEFLFLTFHDEIKMFNLKTSTVDHTFVCDEEQIACAALTPNGEELVVVSKGRTVKAFDVETKKTKKMWSTRDPPPTHALFNDTGDLLAFGFPDHVVQIYHYSKHKPGYNYRVTQGVTSLSFHPIRTHILAVGDMMGRVSYIDTRHSADKGAKVELAYHNSHCTGIAFTAEGDRMVTVARDKSVAVYDVSETKPNKVKDWTTKEDLFQCCALPDGSVVMVGAQGIPRVVDVQSSYATIAEADQAYPDSAIGQLIYLSQSKELLLVSDDDTLLFYTLDVQTAQAKKEGEKGAAKQTKGTNDANNDAPNHAATQTQPRAAGQFGRRVRRAVDRPKENALRFGHEQPTRAAV